MILKNDVIFLRARGKVVKKLSFSRTAWKMAATSWFWIAFAISCQFNGASCQLEYCNKATSGNKDLTPHDVSITVTVTASYNYTVYFQKWTITIRCFKEKGGFPTFMDSREEKDTNKKEIDAALVDSEEEAFYFFKGLQVCKYLNGLLSLCESGETKIDVLKALYRGRSGGFARVVHAATERDGHFFFDLVDFIIDQAVARERHRQWWVQSRNVNEFTVVARNQVPNSEVQLNRQMTAITTLINDRKKGVVFFGNFFAVYDMSITKPLVMDIDGREHFSSSLWLGCPAEVCFDASVDAAINIQDGSGDIFCFRGPWHWYANPNTKPAPTYERNFRYGLLVENIDAAFQHGDIGYFIAGEDFYSINLLNSDTSLQLGKIGPFFPELSQQTRTVDAAFTHNDTLLVISGTRIWTYMKNPDVANSWRIVSQDMISKLWDRPPNGIDAAVQSPSTATQKDQVLFFKGSFVYIYDYGLKERPKGPPEPLIKRHLLQRYLYTCLDNFYAQYTKPLNLLDMNSFEAYRNKFETTGDFRTPASRLVLVLIVVAVVAFVLVIGFSIFYFTKNRPNLPTQ